MPHHVKPPTNTRVPVYAERKTGPVDRWIDTCRAIFGIAPINRSGARKDYISNSWFIDPMTVSHSFYYELAASHSKWHVEESGGQIHVLRYALGRASFQSDGVPLECEQGAITLLDYGRPFSSLNTNNECHSFFIPYDAINYRPSDKPHALVYSGQSRIGQLIGREMDNILSQLQHGSATINHHDIRRFLGCIEVGMCPETASSSATALMRESLKRNVQQFIEDRLESPELNATLILQNFGVSRASLYRMFDADAGVRSYINHRRLVRAVSELAARPAHRGQIHQVSERWGFTSDSNFWRMVKREFGVAPGSLFQMPVQYATSPHPKSDVQAMMLIRAKQRQLELA